MINGPNTHSEVFIGEGFSYFADGVPDRCEHNYTGATYFVTLSGKVIYWHTYRQWASYTSMMRDPLIFQYQLDQDDPVRECGVTCSKCGKPYHPDMF